MLRRFVRFSETRVGMGWLLLALLVVLSAVWVSRTVAHASGGTQDPFVSGQAVVLLDLAIVVMAAFVGRAIAKALNQSAVLGELIMGIAVGNALVAMGSPLFVLIQHLSVVGEVLQRVMTSSMTITDAVRAAFPAEQMQPGMAGDQVLRALAGPEGPVTLIGATALWVFSSLGVILLLVMVGVETSVTDMLKVGARAMAVAVVGVVLPMAFGLGISAFFLADYPFTKHLFIGATLCATSVGITARVFKDLGRSESKEARVILGAAVIDDVLGLVVLAVVMGMVQRGAFDALEAGRILLFAALFLGVIMLFGERLVQLLHRLTRRFGDANLGLILPLGLALVLAYAANLIQLAPIVGAFAAGLILRNDQFVTDQDDRSVEHQLGPLESFFAPVFFVLMGMQVDLSVFGNPATLGLAGALTVVAVLGKVLAGALGGKENDRLSIGVGMIPRGEVGLIFAGIGKSLGVFTDATFGAIVIMIVLTTLMTPLLLKLTLTRGKRPSPA